MTKMNNNSSNADDQLSEDDLVSLERALESGNRAAFDSDSSPKMAYLRAFEAIDQLAAPVRAAIEPFDRPPAIEDYEELTEIARGGMGIVYRGFHKKTKRYDAIKVIRPDRLVGTAKETATLLRLQFLRECQLAARVAHEHIVPVYQVGEVDDSPWYSMQLVEGTSLHELTHGTVISTERIVRYIEQIARTLDVVHRHGILHGDLKPQNILIELQKDKPLIGDFGLAGWEATFESEINAGVVGTPAYLAPELATAALHGSSPDDTKAARTVSSDVYSLGATLWAALAGCSPCFENRSISEQLVDVATGNLKFSQPCDRKLPPVITQIIQKCVSLDPMSRYTSAGELADALSQWLNRPRWTKHFAKLRTLLCVVIAPLLFFSGLLVQLFLALDVAAVWIWFVVFAGYVPLFATFVANQRVGHGAQLAHRQLWSIWIGHLCASIAGLFALQISLQYETRRVVELFYPFWAAVSSLTFFAKSANFWSGYRWLGAAWSLIAICLTLTPYTPIVFGGLAATTCLLIAGLDREFIDE